MASPDNIRKDRRTMRNSSFVRAMRNSLYGIYTILKRERNMRVHVVLAILILSVGIYFKISRSDWLWVFVAITSAITSEFLNTIIESVVDLIVEKTYHPLAKIAKDVAAGGVLVAVMFEVLVLLIIFQPYIWHWMGWPPLHIFDREY
jgi:undecaprenol kinase